MESKDLHVIQKVCDSQEKVANALNTLRDVQLQMAHSQMLLDAKVTELEKIVELFIEAITPNESEDIEK